MVKKIAWFSGPETTYKMSISMSLWTAVIASRLSIARPTAKSILPLQHSAKPSEGWSLSVCYTVRVLRYGTSILHLSPRRCSVWGVACVPSCDRLLQSRRGHLCFRLIAQKLLVIARNFRLFPQRLCRKGLGQPFTIVFFYLHFKWLRVWTAQKVAGSTPSFAFLIFSIF